MKFKNAVITAGIAVLGAAVYEVYKWRRYTQYNDLDNVWREFLVHVMENPDLPHPQPIQGLDNRTAAWFDFVLTMFERAYQAYKDNPHNQQWQGWVAYMRDWMSVPQFREAVDALVAQYDEGFQKVIKSLH